MIYGFMHVYTVNNWEEIVSVQIQKMKDSNLWAWMECLFVGIIGEPKTQIQFDPKIEILYQINKPELEQSLTLSFLRMFAMTNHSDVFYVHTKGVSHFNSKPQADWRAMMEYFILTKFSKCQMELERADVVGVNWHLGEGYMGASAKKAGGIEVTPHFSGNFWWSTTEYIRKLPPLYPLNSKYQCEFWIGKGKPIVAEMWHSGVHHHRSPYPESQYMNKIDGVRYYG